MKIIVSLLSAALLAAVVASGCHGLTEFEGTLHSGVVFIRTDDYTIETTMEGFDDGRAICSIDNNTFYVLGSTGTLYKVDSDEMVIDTSFSVWNGPALGPVDIISPPPRSKVYILGNGADVIEVGVASNAVTDLFWAGPSPVCMVSTRSVPNTSIYFGDSQDNRLREVVVSTNTVVRSAEIGYQPYAMGIDNLEQFLLVSAYYDNKIRVMNIGLDPIHAGQSDNGAGTDIIVPATGSNFFIACPRWEDGSGNVHAIWVDTLGGMSDSLIYLPGHPVRLSADLLGHYLYILSNTGAGSATLTVLDIWFGSGTVAEIELEGYPWDLTVHSNGEYVLVLMAN